MKKKNKNKMEENNLSKDGANDDVAIAGADGEGSFQMTTKQPRWHHMSMSSLVRAGSMFKQLGSTDSNITKVDRWTLKETQKCKERLTVLELQQPLQYIVRYMLCTSHPKIQPTHETPRQVVKCCLTYLLYPSA